MTMGFITYNGFEVFNGHLEQIDYDPDGRIRRLHLKDKDGTRLTVTIEIPEAEQATMQDLRDRPLVFLGADTRPPVTIHKRRW